MRSSAASLSPLRKASLAKDAAKEAGAVRKPKRVDLMQARVAYSKVLPPAYNKGDGVQPLNPGVFQLRQINAAKPKTRAPVAKLKES